MKNKIFTALVCFALLFSVLFCAVPVSAEDSVGRAEQIAEGIISYKLTSQSADSVQEWIDGGLSSTAGTAAEWYILALCQYSEYDFSSYENALLKYLEQNRISSASSRQKYALCLSGIGSTSSYISSVLENSIGEQGIMSYVYGLHLLNNGYKSNRFSSEQIIDAILSLKREDGGWSLTGTVSDVDTTAMAVQALTPYYQTERVGDAIDAAITLLSEKQLSDGDFSSFGVSNPESGAQVLVALSSLGIDAQNDARFIKNGNTIFDGIEKYRLSDGSFCHTEGGSANNASCAQTLYSMVAYLRFRDGRSPLYILDKSDPDNVLPVPRVNEESLLTDTAEISDSESNERQASEEPEKAITYKLYASIALAFVGIIICLVLFLMKKRTLTPYICVILAVCIGIAVICATGNDKKQNVIGTVTVSIRCDKIAGKDEHIPADGIILDKTQIDIADGDTVYDVLTEAARAHKLQIEVEGSATLAYIRGIANIYEFDFGDTAGWTYLVNGESPSVGCGEYKLADGDVIEWHYSLDLGNDLK